MKSDIQKKINFNDLDKLLAESDDLLDEFPYAIAELGDETPQGINLEDLGVEISIYLGWAIDNNLVSEKLEDDNKKLLEKFRNREINSRAILRECCSDKLEVQHLNETGNAFTRCYYRPGWDHFYYEDLGELFPELENFAFLKDDWNTYDAVTEMINSRFKEWALTHHSSD